MGLVIIGHDTETGLPVTVEDTDRLRGMYVIGTNGTGKTTLLESLILQDIEAGLGVCVLDPHRDLIRQVLAQIPSERESDVVLLDPRDSDWPFGLNLFSPGQQADAETRDRLAEQFVEVIASLWGPQGTEGNSWGPNIPMVLRNVAFAFLDNPGLTMVEIRTFLTNKAFRAAILQNVTNEYVRDYWRAYGDISAQEQRNLTSSTLNKLDEFLSRTLVTNILGQSVTTADFRSFMDDGKIVLVPLGLGSLGESVVSLLGSLVVLQVLNAALSREELPPSARRQFNLYADEYQRFATPGFATLLTEARKFGVATTICHQLRSQLDLRNRETALNAGTLVVFGVTGQDGEELAQQFDRTPPQGEVSGRRPTWTVPPDPLGHLIRNGHQDEAVANMAYHFFKPFIDFASDRNAPELNTEGIALAKLLRQEVEEGIGLVNEYLVGMMTGRIEPGSLQQSAIIFDILNKLGDAYAFLPDPRKAHTLGGVLYYTRDAIPEQVATCFRDLVHACVLGIETKYASAVCVFLKRAILAAKESDPSCSSMDEDPTSYYSASLRLFRFGNALQEHPIFVDSGEWEPTYDQRRTFADVEGEIANHLVNQAQFHATCRTIVNGRPREFYIRTPRFFLQDEAHAFTSIGLIQTHSRNLYGRAREQVEEELRARRDWDTDGPSTTRVVPL